jgi:DNA invertase Pin-like site-specific DNA recombinase
VAATEADGLVLARLDRLARALTVQEATLAVLWRSGIEVFTADAGRILRDDPDDPMRTALRQVVGVFSELERRLVVKRLRDGRSAKEALGRKSVGAYSFGYRGSGVGRNRDAAPHPDEQAALEAIVRLRRQGLSYRRIAALLDDLGHSPRRADAWSPMSVRNIALRHLGSES